MNGSSRNDEPYMRIIAGAIASTEAVGVINRRISPLGTANVIAAHTAPNIAAVIIISQHLLYPADIARAVVLRDYRLRRLTYAVGAALDERADGDYDSVDRERVRAEIFHYLAVEEHREHSHRHVYNKRREAVDGYPAKEAEYFF